MCSFKVPENQPYSKLISFGYIRGTSCPPPSWAHSLKDSTNQLMQEPYLIKPSQTYTYCLTATFSQPSCNILNMCLTPISKGLNFKFEHYNRSIYNNRKTLLYTFDNNSTDSTTYTSVSSDGANVSEFRITGLSSINSLNWKLRIAQDPDAQNTDKFGQFESPTISDASIQITYRHPIIPPLYGKYEIINIEIIDANNFNRVVKSFKLRVYRAPLLFVHGKNGSESDFEAMFNAYKNQEYEETSMLKANYSKTSNDYFFVNQYVVEDHIERLLTRVVNAKISAGKVDVVAHSMGGLISRMYLQSVRYKENINKLITHNTPHSGSQSANRMADEVYAGTPDGKVARYFGDWGGAAIDLQVGVGQTISKEINNSSSLNYHIVPSHTIVTTFPFDPEDIFSSYPGVKYASIFAFLHMTPKELFRTDESDLVVAQASQSGGLTGENTTLIQPQIHSQAQENDIVINTVLNLLKENSKGSLFSQTGFKPIDTLRYVRPPSEDLIRSVSLTRDNLILNTYNSTIAINNPQPQKIVKIGEFLNFNVSGVDLQSIEIYIKDRKGNLFPIYSSSNTLNTSVLIDNKYSIGENSFIAVGKGLNSKIVYQIGTFQVVDCSVSNIALNNIINQPYYQTSGTIIASGKVDLGQTVQFLSQKNIVLNPGFESERLTRFTAIINPCSN
jgi:pimeloyl-ACP methyl ester carboxylesterase